jgi:GH15 family glucan-1,4-alpha-glucosidase
LAYQQIHDYGIIGDMSSCALVGRNGSIDWACFPRFDSPSIFGAILDETKGGQFRISATAIHNSTQRYLPDTNVLETTFRTAGGAVTVVDFMPPPRAANKGVPPHTIHRIVRGVEGTVEVELIFQPRFNYGQGEVQIKTARHGVVASQEKERLALVSAVPLTIDSGTATARFTVEVGDELVFVAAYRMGSTPAVRAMDSAAELKRTVRFWQATTAKVEYTGQWREEVMRSFLVLHLLTYSATGAIVAAATTSLPEHIGGSRNWDYRYCWLRDAAWTVGILARMGDPYESKAFMQWTMAQSQLGIQRMQVLYGISTDSELHERELGHLEGYAGSSPVRIGNDAAFHRQIDVFGEVVLSVTAYHRYHGKLPKGGWALVQRLANLAAMMWRLPDRGIWEVRGEEQHFIYSKLMCWVALDRAVLLAQTYGYPGPVDWWQLEARQLRDDLLEHGWSDKKQSFTQHYGTDALDASALLIPFVGFLPLDDPRVRSTIRRVQQELSIGPFVRRYIPSQTDDGLDSEEGAFFLLGFWLIGALLAIGERDEALAQFHELMAHVNHLGLMSEMIDPHTFQALGNFPQAFSHIGLIHTARNLSQAFESD